MQLQSPAKGNLALGDTSGVKVHLQGNQSKSLLLRLFHKSQHFAFVYQQLPVPFGFVIPDRCLRVFGYVTSNQPQFVIFNASVGFVKLTFTIAKTFDFAASQYQTALHCFQNLVAGPNLSIIADYLGAGLRGCSG